MNGVKLFFKHILTLLVETVLKVLWVLPVRDKRIVFISFNGSQISDNPLYIYKALCKRKDIANPDYIWIYDSDPIVDSLGMTTVKPNTMLAFIAISTAKVLVTNQPLRTFIPIRKSQTLIDTWHGGGAFKKYGADDPKSLDGNRWISNHQSLKTGIMLASSMAMEETFKSALSYHGPFGEFGMARNAILLRDHSEAIDIVYNYFDIEKNERTGILLYAPSYRGLANAGEFLSRDDQLDFKKITQALSAKFGKDYQVLVRAHHTMMPAMTKFEFGDLDIFDATSYHDMQELLCAADILITDYSSCYFDMCLMGKPVFFYAPDFDSYVSSQGFYYEPTTYPPSFSVDEEGLLRAIEDFDQSSFIKRVQDFLNMTECFECSDSDERAAELVSRLIAGETLDDALEGLNVLRY